MYKKLLARKSRLINCVANEHHFRISSYFKVHVMLLNHVWSE